MAIRLVDPQATFRVICELDESIISETEAEIEALKTGKKVGTGMRDEKGNEVTVDEYRNSRYQDYMDTLDESKLKFKEGEKPTYFIIRCLLNSEVTEMNDRHYVIDTVGKRMMLKDRSKWLTEHFERGCLGIEVTDANGKTSIQKISADQLGLGVALNVGGMVSVFTQIGKNLKK